MTKIKLCGITRLCDIEAVNELKPEYIGFVFAKKSKRYVAPEVAERLRRKLSHEIQAVGVFVDESVQQVAKLLREHVIDIAQLHGSEDDDYIRTLRELTSQPIIKAFRIRVLNNTFLCFSQKIFLNIYRKQLCIFHNLQSLKCAVSDV